VRRSQAVDASRALRDQHPRATLDCAQSLRLALVMLSALCAEAPAATQHSPLELARTHGCMTCHGMVRKQVGPGFAQIAQRYGNDREAAAVLAARIRTGSVGNWGRVIMPRQPQVIPADATALAAWILTGAP
jgi:cytochrome c